ncbi:MAG: DNA pilot protein [Microviridae sp.]|nr:MAG: DNA pilot protein [Microviridae sp.]
MGFFDLGISDLLGAGTKLLGGMMSEDSADKRAAQNIAMQREFAQQGVSWKVADAKRAGISPLAALGASTNSFSNVVGGEGKVGEAVSDMGQDISRAATAASSGEQKSMLMKSAALDIEKKGLENDLLKTELADKARKISAPGQPPGIPGPTTGIPGAGPEFPTTTIGAPKVDQEKRQNQFSVLGANLMNDPWTSDAQHLENIFGDEGPFSWFYWVPKVPSVAAWNAARWAAQRRKQMGTDIPGGGKY